MLLLYLPAMLLFFVLFLSLQYSAPASRSVYDPLHPPPLFCRVATLPSSLCVCLDFYTPIPYLLS